MLGLGQFKDLALITGCSVGTMVACLKSPLGQVGAGVNFELLSNLLKLSNADTRNFPDIERRPSLFSSLQHGSGSFDLAASHKVLALAKAWFQKRG